MLVAEPVIQKDGIQYDIQRPSTLGSIKAQSKMGGGSWSL